MLSTPQKRFQQGLDRVREDILALKCASDARKSQGSTNSEAVADLKERVQRNAETVANMKAARTADQTLVRDCVRVRAS